MKKHYLLTNLFIFCFLVINAQNSPSVKFKSIIKPTFRQTSTLAAQIDSIELYNDKTAFFMTVTIPYENGGWVKVNPPGSLHAFVLISNNQYYELIKVKGIVIAPEKTNLKYKESISFELIFKPLPANTRFVSLIEGKEKELGVNIWSFGKIRLFDYEQTTITRKNLVRFFRISNKNLFPSESFWVIKAKFHKITTDSIFEKNIIPNSTDTIVSYVEKNQLKFLDLNGNELPFLVHKDMIKSKYLKIHFKYANDTFMEIIQTPPNSNRLKLKKSIAKKAWQQSYDKSAKY